MIITQFDGPLSAEDARKISINNRDDSQDRMAFRDIMTAIKNQASFGYTRHITMPRARAFFHPSEYVQNALRSLGYRVIEKRAYEYDNEKKEYSKDKPALDFAKREQFFLEITWG